MIEELYQLYIDINGDLFIIGIAHHLNLVSPLWGLYMYNQFIYKYLILIQRTKIDIKKYG